MKKNEYALITFKSTHYALRGEEVFEEEDMDFKTIPTPREVSHSCGLSLLFFLEDLDRVKRIIEERDLAIDGLFKFIRDGSNSKADRIL